MEPRTATVVVAGGINLDLHLTPHRGTFTAGSSTPSRLALSMGGVARNVAENLARLALPVTLLGAVGDDAQSEVVLETTARVGVDVSGVVRRKDLTCGTYVALLNGDGSLAYGAAAMEATESIGAAEIAHWRAAIEAAACLVVDANLPVAALEAMVAIANACAVPVVLEPVSVAKAGRVASVAGEILLATPNRDEREAVEELRRLRLIAVTEGGAGATLYDRRDGGRLHVAAPPVEVVDETGAGDAFVAGMVYGIVTGAPTVRALRMGIAAASLAVSSAASSPARLTRAALTTIIEQMEETP